MHFVTLYFEADLNSSPRFLHATFYYLHFEAVELKNDFFEQINLLLFDRPQLCVFYFNSNA